MDMTFSSSNGQFRRQRNRPMVRPEHDCSSTSVNVHYHRYRMSRISCEQRISRRIAANEFDKQVNVHVAMDNTLVLKEIREFIDYMSLIMFHVIRTFVFNIGQLCQIKSNIRSGSNKSTDVSTKWKPLVIIIPLRLGLSDVNTEYIDQLKVDKETVH
jgi:hypothetical protein